MTELASGSLLKMNTVLEQPVEYSLPVGAERVELNPFLGRKISLKFSGRITCVDCGRLTNKSFNQGFCYPCFTSKAACDRCIVSPEHCHFAAGTCREPQWAAQYCNVDHFVYVANSTGIKVGITRHTQIPTRWIDQGATQALPLFRVSTRHQSGALEVAFKEHIADKTQWQRMLKGDPEPLDLIAQRKKLLELVSEKLRAFERRFGEREAQALPDATVTQISYPVVEHPKKVISLNFDKTATVEGTLMGIKGQYLILDSGVINIRKFGGYHVTLGAD